jgi:ubiquinone/menaquinone biosynthesis C-methylase UbiE
VTGSTERTTHSAARAGLDEGSREWGEWVKDYYRDVETYDWVDVADHLRGPEAIFHRNRAYVVRKLVRAYGQTPFLDAGCGTGLNLRNLPPGSTGLDINPRNLAVVRHRLPEANVVQGDIEAMPFDDLQFGAVLCTEVLEHVPEPEKALQEIRRVLRPGGVLIGSVPARSMIWRLRFLSSTCPHEEPFHNEYTKDEVRQLLVGWVIERLKLSLMHFNVMFVARR